MKAIGKFFRENGLYTMVANNSIHTNPPLCITEEQLAEGFEIIDRRARHRRPGGRLSRGRSTDVRWRPPAGRSPVRRSPGRGRRPTAARPRSSASSSSSSSSLLVIWEGAKWLGGDPWRIHGSVARHPVDYEHVPPFTCGSPTTCRCPTLGHRRGVRRRRPSATAPPLGLILAGQALFTFREALIGLRRSAACSGSASASCSSIRGSPSGPSSRTSSRRQTVPILAISPLIVVATKADWLSVDRLVAAYLTFFPVTIAALRGLRAADPRAFELLRSYAASRRQSCWKLRLPTSVALPLLALRVAAAAAVIGAIIGELPAGRRRRARQRDPQLQPVLHPAPERLWATIVMCTLSGLAFVGHRPLAEDAPDPGAAYRPTAARAGDP